MTSLSFKHKHKPHTGNHWDLFINVICAENIDKHRILNARKWHHIFTTQIAEFDLRHPAFYIRLSSPRSPCSVFSMQCFSLRVSVEIWDSGGVKDAAGSPRYKKLGHIIQRNKRFLCTIYCSNLCRFSGSLSLQIWVFYLKISPHISKRIKQISPWVYFWQSCDTVN